MVPGRDVSSDAGCGKPARRIAKSGRPGKERTGHTRIFCFSFLTKEWEFLVFGWHDISSLISWCFFCLDDRVLNAECMAVFDEQNHVFLCQWPSFNAMEGGSCSHNAVNRMETKLA